jgi:hypothetical protein
MDCKTSASTPVEWDTAANCETLKPRRAAAR